MKAGAITISVLALLAGSLVHADEAENYIKYRQAMMKAIGGHMGAATQIVRGKVLPAGHLAMHAKALAELTADLPSLFPEGSDFGETQAKPEIWEQWDKFEQAAGAAKTATAQFADAVAGGDQATIAAAHKKVGEACKGCHKHYREKDE